MLNYATRPAMEFRSSATLATISKIFLIATMCLGTVLSALGIVMVYTGVYERIEIDQDISSRDSMLLIAVLAIAALAVLSFIGTVIVFCMWMYRAHRNTSALGIKAPRHSSGWAVGYWFIPILNLFRPYQAMQDVYDGSHRTAASDPARSTIGWWWAAWLIGNFAERISARLENRSVSPQAIAAIDIIASLLNIAAGVMLIWLITRIVTRQAESVAAGSAAAISA